AGDGANDDAFVHDAGDAREDFADLDAGDVGGDRLELRAKRARRLGLDLPHILVGRPAAKIDIDDGFARPGRTALGRLGTIDVCKIEGRGTEREGADLEEIAARDAVAVAAGRTHYVEHGEPLFPVCGG